MLVKAVLAVLRVVTGRYRRFGTAAAAFGAPFSLRAYLAEVPDGAAEGLGARMLIGSQFGSPIIVWAALFAAAILAGVLILIVRVLETVVTKRMGVRA